MLSGYRLVWMMVMFDLPVAKKAERRAAARFRLGLLDLGFEMVQFSVYLRFCAGQPKADALAGRVEAALPAGGRVTVLFITDKQYGRILTFHSGSRVPSPKPPDQFDLF